MFVLKLSGIQIIISFTLYINMKNNSKKEILRQKLIQTR